MKCNNCPYSLACMSGRLDRLFVMVGLCPECQRLYCLVDRVAEDERRKERLSREQQQRIEERKAHGIDLDYEKYLYFDTRYQREWMGVFIPAPRTTIVAFKCEKRRLGRAELKRWQCTRVATQGQYRYTSGWAMLDPAGLIAEPLHIRPCPECVRWPESHIIEDLDAKEKYEAEKKGSTPAFRLKT